MHRNKIITNKYEFNFVYGHLWVSFKYHRKLNLVYGNLRVSIKCHDTDEQSDRKRRKRAWVYCEHCDYGNAGLNSRKLIRHQHQLLQEAYLTSLI